MSLNMKHIKEKVKSDLIRKIASKIKRINEWKAIKNEIIIILWDIHNFLINKEQPKSMQGLLRIHALFRGFIVKDWTEDNKTITKFWKFNKIIVK